MFLTAATSGAAAALMFLLSSVNPVVLGKEVIPLLASDGKTTVGKATVSYRTGEKEKIRWGRTRCPGGFTLVYVQTSGIQGYGADCGRLSPEEKVILIDVVLMGGNALPERQPQRK